MAKIVPAFGPIKGKVGGVTFQVNPAGNTMRATPRPRKSSSTKQSQAHQTHQRYLNQWSSLTLTQQMDWATFAATYTKIDKFGVDRTITGLNWFESVNQQLVFAGMSEINSPPTHDTPAAVPAFVIILSASAIKIGLSDTYDFGTGSLIIFASLPLFRMGNSQIRFMKRMLTATSAPGDMIDITSEWEEATGLIWSPNTTFPAANIRVQIQSMSNASGITTALSSRIISTAGISPYDADAQAYFDAVGTPFTTPRKVLINNLVVQLKADGNWNVMDRMYLLANESADQGLVSLINPLSTNASPVSSPNFVIDRGYTSNGTTSYIDTNYNPATDGVNFILNDSSLGVYSRTNIAQNSYDFGSYKSSTTVRTQIACRKIGDVTESAMSTVNVPGVTAASSLSLMTIARNSSTHVETFQAGASLGAITDGSTSLSSLKLFIGCTSFDNTPLVFSTRQIAFAFAGSSAIDQAALYSAIQTFMTAIGANV